MPKWNHSKQIDQKQSKAKKVKAEKVLLGIQVDSIRVKQFPINNIYTYLYTRFASALSNQFSGENSQCKSWNCAIIYAFWENDKSEAKFLLDFRRKYIWNFDTYARPTLWVKFKHYARRQQQQ